MITLKPVFFGTIPRKSSNESLIYRYIFASADPVVYFVAYGIPSDNHIELFFTQEFNNLYNESSICLDDKSKYGYIKLEYGVPGTISVKNNYLVGFSEIVEVNIVVKEKPVLSETTNYSGVQLNDAIEFAKKELKPLYDNNLFVVVNLILVSIEVTLDSILKNIPNPNVESVVRYIINANLTNSYNLFRALDISQNSETWKTLKRLFSVSCNVSPVNSTSAENFVKIVEFSKKIRTNNISIENIPYIVLIRLFARWSEFQNDFELNRIKIASENIIKTEQISFDMSSMEDSSTVYELISLFQKFIYIKKIDLKHEDGRVVTVEFDNQLWIDFTRESNDCHETKILNAKNGNFGVQYGYGNNCDYYAGIFYEALPGKKYGYKREDKVIDGKIGIERTFRWEEETVVSSGDSIPISPLLTVEVTGV